MTFIQIIQLILSLAPTGIQLTQEIVQFVLALEAALKTASPEAQTAVIATAQAHLAKLAQKA